MKRIALLLLALASTGCASLMALEPGARERSSLWERAHHALAQGRFGQADSVFKHLADEHARSKEGREALFFLGALRLDPRNPEWNPRPAEATLRDYLAIDTTGARVERRAEADMLVQLAAQLNLPAEERVSGLRPETRVVQVPRVVYRAEQCQAPGGGEVVELRRQIAERDEQIKRQREELERIRKTLTPRTP